MSILDLCEYVRKQARDLRISDSELARRAEISRPALRKLLNGEVKDPEIKTVANLAYAIDENPYRLVSLFLAGTQPALRDQWKNTKKDGSRFVSDVTYPDGAQVRAGKRFNKVWEITNTGEIPWLGRKLICTDKSLQLYRKEGDDFIPLNYALTPVTSEIPIPDTLPKDSVQLAVDFIAPTTPAWVVSYWKMLDRDGNMCFPELEGLRCCVDVIEV